MADKTLNEIRETFLNYFEKNDHKKIEGNPLDPEKAAKDQIEDPIVETKDEVTPPKKN